jgi:hypothetical protein
MPAGPHDRVITYTEFCGGPMRPVYEDSDGLQYVHDDDGEIVRGNWLMPRDLPDEPLVVDSTD